jgi:hypothetical protein
MDECASERLYPRLKPYTNRSQEFARRKLSN